MSILLVLTTLCATATVLAFGWALTSAKTLVHDRVAQLGGLSDSQAKNIAVFEQLYDRKTKSKMQQRLTEAGWYRTTPARVGYYSAVVALLTALVLTLLLIVSHKLSVQSSLFIALGAGAGWSMPNFAIDRAIKARKIDIQCSIPDFLDLISSMVAAGIALNGAIAQTAEALHGPLADEFRASLSDIRMGKPRIEALNMMAARVNQPDLSTMINALTQSERVGGNISKVLDELALEARDRRFSRAEEIANTLPLKMTFPMALFLLPALIVIIFGPVVASLHM